MCKCNGAGLTPALTPHQATLQGLARLVLEDPEDVVWLSSYRLGKTLKSRACCIAKGNMTPLAGAVVSNEPIIVAPAAP